MTPNCEHDKSAKEHTIENLIRQQIDLNHGRLNASRAHRSSNSLRNNQLGLSISHSGLVEWNEVMWASLLRVWAFLLSIGAWIVRNSRHLNREAGRGKDELEHSKNEKQHLAVNRIHKIRTFLVHTTFFAFRSVALLAVVR